MEHTPGPWKASIWKDGDSHQGNRIMAADGFEVANLSYTGAQEDQDARLLAEAPNMLDALDYAATALHSLANPASRSAHAMKLGRQDAKRIERLVREAIKAATS